MKSFLGSYSCRLSPKKGLRKTDFCFRFQESFDKSMGTHEYTVHCRVVWWTVRICGNTSEFTTLSYRFLVTGGLSTNCTNLFRLVVIKHMRDGGNTFSTICGSPRTFFCFFWRRYSKVRGICIFFWRLFISSRTKKDENRGKKMSPYNYDEYKHWWRSNMNTHTY